MYLTERFAKAAEELQTHIEKICESRTDVFKPYDAHGQNSGRFEIPQVATIFTQTSTVVEVEELRIWNSENEGWEITGDLLIARFTKICRAWGAFSG